MSLFLTPGFHLPPYRCSQVWDNEIQDLLVAEVFSIPIQVPKGVTRKRWPQCPLEAIQVLVPGVLRKSGTLRTSLPHSGKPTPPI